MPTADPWIDTDARRRLAIGGLCSLLVHGGALTFFLARPGGLGANPLPLPVALPAADTPPDEITPGIEQSKQVTINWLGFDDPTPHSATRAEIDQAALSPNQAGVPEQAEPTPDPATELAAEQPAEIPVPDPGEQTEPIEVVEAVMPDPSEAVESTEAVAVVAAAEPADDAAEASSAETADATERDAGTEAESSDAPILAVTSELPDVSASRLFRTLSRAASRAREAFAEAQAEVQAEVQAQAEAIAQAAPAAEQGGGAPASSPPPGDPNNAIASEKESDATSREPIAEWTPGKPPAVEGLDITTVRPRWTVTTRLSVVPRNPVVRIEFLKNGTVARAVFLDKQNTGHTDVDGPLLDAIYAWTAKGKALDALPAADPRAVAPITMRIILIPERGKIHRIGDDR